MVLSLEGALTVATKLIKNRFLVHSVHQTSPLTWESTSSAVDYSFSWPSGFCTLQNVWCVSSSVFCSVCASQCSRPSQKVRSVETQRPPSARSTCPVWLLLLIFFLFQMDTIGAWIMERQTTHTLGHNGSIPVVCIPTKQDERVSISTMWEDIKCVCFCSKDFEIDKVLVRTNFCLHGHTGVISTKPQTAIANDP